MAILPEGRVENVEASLFTYVRDNFTLVPVDYAGAGVDEENINEWLRIDVMLPDPNYARQVGDGHMGAEQLVLLNMNINRKQSIHEEDTYGLVRIRDTIADLFRVPLGIGVFDHVETGGSNRIGTLQTSVLASQNIGFNESMGVYQYNLTSTMRYVMKWEAPS